MPIEETDETRVRTDCLNFNVFLCLQIKKQISIGSVVLDPAAAQDCTYFPSLLTNVALQLLRDIING